MGHGWSRNVRNGNGHDLVRLSRAASHALRHAPEAYGLALEPGGWVAVDALLDGLRGRNRRWADLERTDLVRMIERADKARFELRGERIRALYGHSAPVPLDKERSRPPALLYHGTTPAALPGIRRDGLRPMGRQHVHLSVDVETARQVGRRRTPQPVILVIRAGEAHEAGVPFFEGNAAVWLAEHVPPAFVDVPDGEDDALAVG